MGNQTILHCMYAEKFIDPFIEFVEKNFNPSGHLYIVRQLENFPTKYRGNIILLNERVGFMKRIFIYGKHLNRAEKIVLHGLFDRGIVLMLFMQPWLLKKCYWVMWGGDLYHYQNRSRGFLSNQFEKIRAAVIKEIGHLVTYVKGDYELAQKWYEAKGEYRECLIYPSNLYKEYAVQPKIGDAVNILVGNSADPSNNHLEAFEKLLPFKGENVMIYCPLSYGPADYAERITKLGKEMFGDKFIPLLEFMPFEKYLELLGQIDIAVFAHKRQQAMGNTITLLGLGKKVYMRNDVTPWAMFDALGVRVFDVRKFDLLPLNDDERQNNQARIKSHFSEAALAKQLNDIFEG